jgi:hypothetical protein
MCFENVPVSNTTKSRLSITWPTGCATSPENNENEKKKIVEIERVNGYPANRIQRIITNRVA